MAEPDFTDPDLTAQLADTIKQEPLEFAGPSCSNDPQSNEANLPENPDHQQLQQEEAVLEEEWPPIPVDQRPKPERYHDIRQLPYMDEELNARVLDFRCNPDWPLAHLYPVYLGNFRVPNLNMCQTAVRQYFAIRGYLVRWCFSRADDYFRQFQRKANLYDGLVYFGSEREAMQVIKNCDNTLYNNYTMNVFPGREPVYFKADRSLQYRNMRFGYVYSEEFLWRHLVRYGGGVRTVVKFDISNGAAEFYTPEQMQKAFAEERQFAPTRVPHDRALQKQRYIECNVKDQILELIRQNPTSVDLDPNDPFLQAIQAGRHKKMKMIQCYGPPEQGTGRGLLGIPLTKAKLEKKFARMREIVDKAVAVGRKPVYAGRTKDDQSVMRKMYQEALKKQKNQQKQKEKSVSAEGSDLEF